MYVWIWILWLRLFCTISSSNKYTLKTKSIRFSDHFPWPKPISTTNTFAHFDWLASSEFSSQDYAKDSHADFRYAHIIYWIEFGIERCNNINGFVNSFNDCKGWQRFEVIWADLLESRNLRIVFAKWLANQWRIYRNEATLISKLIFMTIGMISTF